MKMNRAIFKLLIICIVICVIYSVPNLSSGKSPFTDELYATSKGLGTALEDPEKTGTSFSEVFEPRIGLFYGPIIPMGSAGESMGISMVGLNLFSDLLIPSKYLYKVYIPIYKIDINLRMGASVGYSSLSSNVTKFDASLSIIPMNVYAKFTYPVKALRQAGRLEPFLLVGPGLSYASLVKEFPASVTAGPTDQYARVTKSSVEGNLSVSLGASFGPKAIQNIDFLLAWYYLKYFGQAGAGLMSVSLGAFYQL